MAGADPHRSCPHCGATLRAFEIPDAATWDSPAHYACFNDDCPYYREGWDWMWTQYGARASYRYRVDPASGRASPIPVWSATALLDRILDDPT